MLERWGYTPNWGTFGWMTIDSTRYVTLEREWQGNAPNVSCVPEGVYSLLWHPSPRWGRRLHLHGGTVAITPQEMAERSVTRWGCLIHPATWSHQLAGCIALGQGEAVIEDKPGIINSRMAVAALERAVGDQGTEIEIRPWRSGWDRRWFERERTGEAVT